MPEDQLLHHHRIIEAEFHRLPNSVRIVFALTCLQRVIPLFELEAGRHQLVSYSVSEIWGWAINHGERPTVNLVVFEGIIPDANAVSDEYFQAANIIYGTVAIILGDTQDECWRVAVSSLALLENYVYRTSGLEISHANDRVVAAHPLLMQEMQRQLRDLRSLTPTVSSSELETIRQRALQEDIFVLLNGMQRP